MEPYEHVTQSKKLKKKNFLKKILLFVQKFSDILNNNTTVDFQTTKVWTAWVHLYAGKVYVDLGGGLVPQLLHCSMVVLILKLLSVGSFSSHKWGLGGEKAGVNSACRYEPGQENTAWKKMI